MSDIAVYKDLSRRRDDVTMDARCLTLLTGADRKDLPDANPREWPAGLVRNARRRVREYEAATGRSDPDIRDLLEHYARREGVELVREVSGLRIVVVAQPTGDDAA